MKRLSLFSLFFILVFALRADMPGNRPRANTQVHLSGVKNISGWVLYLNSNYGEKITRVSKDTIITIQGGYGRPQGISIYAENKTTHAKTAELSYFAGSEKPEFVNIVAIRNDSLILGKAKPTAKPAKGKKAQPAIQKGAFPSLLDIPAGENEMSKNTALIVLAGISLLALTALFIRARRNKKA